MRDMDGADWVSVFTRLDPGRASPDALALSHWNDEQWRKLLSHTSPRPFRASDVVIQRGGTDTMQFPARQGGLPGPRRASKRQISKCPSFWPHR